MGSPLPLLPPSILPCRFTQRNVFLLLPRTHSGALRSARQRSCIHALDGRVESSWVHSEGSSDDDGYGGWSSRRLDTRDKNGLWRFFLAGAGASVAAILVAAVAYCSCSMKGASKESVRVAKQAKSNVLEDSFGSTDDMPHVSTNVLKQNKGVSGENKPVVVSVSADPTQLEALQVLKKLKIIECDASANELCTRREYARWLVKANCALERKANHWLVPIVSSAGSGIAAFDDVNIDDPDFWCIQALGETGIVPSRLSSSKSSNLSDIMNHDRKQEYYFFPDSFISRFDMVNWKAIIEYSMPFERKEQMSRTKVSFLDLSANTLDSSPQLLMDLLSGDRSVFRRTFGNTRRLQLSKPIIKAQAAVALASGRMAEAIRCEISRLEAEELSRLAEMEEIRSDFILQGVIQKHWEEKLSEEKNRTLQVDMDLKNALFNLELEKTANDDKLVDYMKDKTGLECQQQLLFNLKEEVDEMSQKLGSEKASFIVEKQNLENLLKDFQEEREAIFETKSVLESEKEAVKILRSWVEAEAWQIKAKVVVLEQALQRWKANDNALPQ
ncbi:hypothetical protein AXF42_Ash005890 [Apostasia shenzhenica]|uniref:SLH domain-containing protein n=1 Tax=Apostasia shenzhenica TaxID=1088818 RepID=A0A2I0BCQ8_9ASPA|nr:hypothetical protein AXF42_Ash005890 [Apostasia shenzhenica]